MERERQRSRRKVEQQASARVDRAMDRARRAMARERRPDRRGTASSPRTRAGPPVAATGRATPRGAARPGALPAGATAHPPPGQGGEGTQRSEDARRLARAATERRQREATAARASVRQQEAREIRARARNARRTGTGGDSGSGRAVEVSAEKRVTRNPNGPEPRAASKVGFEALRGGISIERAKERRIGRAEIQARNRRELRVIWERRRAENVVANSDRRGGESELGEPRPPPEPPD